MPLFQIRRNLAGWTEADLDAAAVRTQTCAAWFDGMEWIRSFLDDRGATLYCYYKADSPEDLERHAKAAEVPCDEIIEVREVLPLSDFELPSPAPGRV